MSGPALTPLEVAAGLVLERHGAGARLPRVPPESSPRAAFEAPVLAALRRPPCLVSFSGGRDSSAALAIAAHVARREGLPLPIPATNRFPNAAGSIEDGWQERVVAHLGLADWVRVEIDDELDCVGPVAVSVLRRHGLLWPCNVHFHVPLLEAAAGGALLTGIGGDEAFTGSVWGRALAVAGGRARPALRDTLRTTLSAAPRPVKRAVMRRRMPPLFVWMRPGPRRAVLRDLAAEAAAEPLRWRARYAQLLDSHYLAVGVASLDVLAADEDVQVHHPFRDPGFLAALGALPRKRRFSARSEAMELLAGDVLPAALSERRDKARFDGAFWTGHSRALVERWDGTGVDAELVDPGRLRGVWESPAPDARSFTLLQSVCLALDGGGPSARGKLEKPVGSGRQ